LAFGKVILLGEHAVVYGEPALAGALARGVTATAAPRDGGPSSLTVPAWDARVTTDDAIPLAAALADLVGAVAGNDRAFEVVAEATLPPGAGLGSSAALAVAITRALAAATRRELSDGDVERIANTAERRFHANPSGIDVALAARGGLGVYRRGHGLTIVHALPVRVVIGLSGEPRTTAAMVRKVAAAVEANASNRRRLQSLGESAEAGAEAVESGDLARLGRLLDTAHELLAPLGVSTPSLDLLVNTARGAGALGAKLTGAGGGGAVVALAPDREDEIIEAWRAAGFDGFACEVGVTA
jgi:mevalonate kinase